MARILIVDDLPEVRRMLRSRLEKGHELVGELSDGYAAASEEEETQPDVVIIDFKMPRVSAFTRRGKSRLCSPTWSWCVIRPLANGVRKRMLQAGAHAVFAKEDLMKPVAFVIGLQFHRELTEALSRRAGAPLVHGRFLCSARRGGIKAAAVPLRSLFSPPAPPVPLTLS